MTVGLCNVVNVSINGQTPLCGGGPTVDPGGPLVIFDDTFWANGDNLIFEGDPLAWRTVDVFENPELIPVEVGSNTGWQQGFRPTTVIFTFEIGATDAETIAIEFASVTDIIFESETSVTSNSTLRVEGATNFTHEEDIASLAISADGTSLDLTIVNIEFIGGALGPIGDTIVTPDFENVPTNVRDYQFVSDQWELVSAQNQPGANLLVAINNWADGARPSAIRITANSGPDANNFGFLTGSTISVLDTDSNTIGMGNFDWSEYEESIIVDIPLTFGGLDIHQISVNSFLYTIGPILQTVELIP